MLVEQLKNADKSINEVRGFCFPKSSEDSCVCLMTVTWSVALFRFEIKYSVLAAKDVEKQVKAVLGRHGSVSLCRVERENKMAATYNVLALKR